MPRIRPVSALPIGVAVAAALILAAPAAGYAEEPAPVEPTPSSEPVPEPPSQEPLPPDESSSPPVTTPPEPPVYGDFAWPESTPAPAPPPISPEELRALSDAHAAAAWLYWEVRRDELRAAGLSESEIMDAMSGSVDAVAEVARRGLTGVWLERIRTGVTFPGGPPVDGARAFAGTMSGSSSERVELVAEIERYVDVWLTNTSPRTAVLGYSGSIASDAMMVEPGATWHLRLLVTPGAAPSFRVHPADGDHAGAELRTLSFTAEVFTPSARVLREAAGRGI